MLSHRSINLLVKNVTRENFLPQIQTFSTTCINFNNDNNTNDNNKEGEDFIIEQPQPQANSNNVPATQIVPEIYPIVPLVTVNRNPLFPKFVKLVEISDEKMVKMLRTKVRLNRPYVGVFVKKEDSNENEMIDDLDKIYQIGTFSQIVEMQDLGNRLRMVI